MIESLLKIEFVPAGGGSDILLLDYGDDVDGFPKFPMAQQDISYTAVGADWARGKPMGGASLQASWSRMQYHTTHQAAMWHCLTHQKEMPINVPGKLRVSVQDGGTVEYKDARILACTPTPLTNSSPGRVPTITEYRAAMGEPVIVEEEEFTQPVLEPGDPPALVESGELEPGDPPMLVPPAPGEGGGMPIGLIISGVIEPAEMNRYVPIDIPPPGEPYRWQDGLVYVWMYDRIPDPETGDRWKIHLYEGFYGGFRQLVGTEFPWQDGGWEAFEDAVGSPVITPVYS